MDRRPDVFLLSVDSLRAGAFADTAERLARFRVAEYETVRTLYRRTCDGLGRAVERFVARLRDRGLYDPESDVLAASWESFVRVPLVVARPRIRVYRRQNALRG